MNSLGSAIPVTRVHEMHETGEGDGIRGSEYILVNYDRESSVFMTGLSLEHRGSCAVSTSAAAVPVVNGSIAVTENCVRPGMSAGEAATKQSRPAHGAMARNVEQ